MSFTATACFYSLNNVSLRNKYLTKETNAHTRNFIRKLINKSAFTLWMTICNSGLLTMKLNVLAWTFSCMPTNTNKQMPLYSTVKGR